MKKQTKDSSRSKSIELPTAPTSLTITLSPEYIKKLADFISFSQITGNLEIDPAHRTVAAILVAIIRKEVALNIE